MTTQAESEPPEPSAQPSLFTGRFVLLLVYQVTFGSGWSVFLLLPKFMTTQLHASSSDIGVTIALSGLGAVLGVPIAGPAFHRLGRKPMLQLGVLVTAATGVLFVLVDRVGPLLFVLQFVQGLGFIFAFNAAGTMAADMTPASRMAQGLGYFGASNIVTNAIAPSIAETVAGAYSWTHVWWMSGAFMVSALVLSNYLHEDARQSAVAPSSGSAFSALRDPFQIRMIFVSVLVGAAFCSLLTFHQPFALAMGITEMRPFFIGFTLAAVFVRIGFGTLGDRFGRRRVSMMSLVLYGVAAMSLVTLQPGMLWIFGVLHGTAHGLFYPTGNALVVQRATPEQRGLVLTAFNGGFHAGVALGVYAFGRLAEAAGYPAVFLVGGGLAFWGAWLVADSRAPVPKLAPQGTGA